MNKILVTGGAGYIGSFMTRALLDAGYNVVVFDNLKRGHRKFVDSRAEFVKGDITNEKDLENLFGLYNIDAIIHFAGLIAVGESEKNPELYYQNNVVGSKNLFETAINAGKVTKFIFSSSAAVYGNPIKVPIDESHPKNPTSEYGKNKLEVEKILSSLQQKNSISFTALRYFNACGASLDGKFGEAHIPETHIIPNILNSILKDEDFNLFGTDYKTPDGTCIRDYIHVLDLVEAHILALQKIEKEQGGFFYNVGTGKGFSNREIIESVEKIAGKSLKVKEQERRAGDSDELVADVTKIKKELGFEPKYSDITTIVSSAWKWHSKFIK